MGPTKKARGVSSTCVKTSGDFFAPYPIEKMMFLFVLF